LFLCSTWFHFINPNKITQLGQEWENRKESKGKERETKKLPESQGRTKRTAGEGQERERHVTTEFSLTETLSAI
jgi:hypothetical protein